MTATKEATELEALNVQLGKARQRLAVATKGLHALNGHRPEDDGLAEGFFSAIAVAEKQVVDIETAIQREKEGISGVCERCGGEIDLERRRILPTTTLCVRCKTKEEEPKRRSRRVYA